jgi:hypothetical protein
MNKIIGAYLTGQVKKSDTISLMTLYCECPTECPILKEGKCIHIGFLSRCVYGRFDSSKSPSPRAKGFYTWKDEQKKLIETLPRCPSFSVGNFIEEIGDYVYLNYSHITMNEGVPFLAKSYLFDSGMPFLLKKDFTLENIIKMIKFRPQALFGGEITEYQQKTVPLFLQHLQLKYPELFGQIPIELLEKYKVLPNITYSQPIKVPIKYISAGIVEGYSIKYVSKVLSWDGKRLHVVGSDGLLCISFSFDRDMSVSEGIEAVWYPDLNNFKVLVTDPVLITKLVQANPNFLQM